MCVCVSGEILVSNARARMIYYIGLDGSPNSSGGKRISVLHISCLLIISQFFFSFAIPIAIMLHQCNHRKKAVAQQNACADPNPSKWTKHTTKWFMHLEFAGTRHVEHAHLPTTFKQKTSQWTPYSNGNGLIYVLRALYGRNRVCLYFSSFFFVFCAFFSFYLFFFEVKLEVFLFGKRNNMYGSGQLGILAMQNADTNYNTVGRNSGTWSLLSTFLTLPLLTRSRLWQMKTCKNSEKCCQEIHRNEKILMRCDEHKRP